MKTEIAKMKEMCKAMMDTLNRIEDLDTETTFDELDVGDWFRMNERGNRLTGIKIEYSVSRGNWANTVLLGSGELVETMNWAKVEKIEKEI